MYVYTWQSAQILTQKRQELIDCSLTGVSHVIAQQYFSATFASVQFHCHQVNFGVLFKSYYFNIS
jgi:hypothetical protein